MFRFFSSNVKTGFSYDFGICPLMKEVEGKYRAVCGVEKCYSAMKLNSHQGGGLKTKLQNISGYINKIEQEVKILNAMSTGGPVLVRGFSFADYIPEFKEEFLYLVRNLVTRHIIISKTLWLLAPELIEEVGEATELSLGFTRQLYPKFKKFFSEHQNLKFSVAYTYSNLEDLEWFKQKDPELFSQTDVFHDEFIHLRKGRQFSKLKGTDQFTPSALGMQRTFRARLDALNELHVNAGSRQCNVYGADQKIKACAACTGCGTISRKNHFPELRR